MSNDIYSYIKENFGIEVTDYQFKRDYIKEPLKITKNGIGSERPYKEDLEYLYLTLNLSSKNLQTFFKISEATLIRWNRFYKIKKDKKLSSKNRYKTYFNKYGVFNNSQLKKWKNNISLKKQEISSKRYFTMKKNGSCGKSKEEDKIYDLLIKKYPNIIRHYKCILYPFICDFYIPELDLYIEYQGYWKHGKEPYIGSNIQKEIIKLWEKRSKEINFKGEFKKEYSDAIKRWSISDPLKRETAKRNNLNWIEFFNMNEFMDWYNSL